jgi:hypothetical protein
VILHVIFEVSSFVEDSFANCALIAYSDFIGSFIVILVLIVEMKLKKFLNRNQTLLCKENKSYFQV